jgi:hypothetical protein
MKFICLGFAEEKGWEGLSTGGQDALLEKCFVYDDELLKNGHWLDGGQALQSTRTAKTLRWKNGKVIVTDGPFAETKEQLGGLGVLEARDMAHAVELMSKHPGISMGPFEIRPLDEDALKRQMAAVEKNRSDDAAAPLTDAGTAKFASLGYIGGGECPSNSDFGAMIEECIAFDKARQRAGHWISGIALKSAETAKTLRSKNGRVVATDGPFAETKEQLGGVVVSQFRDIHQAVDVLSAHPALRFGVVIEIRPIDEAMNARWDARKDRIREASH